ncbi:hypothetical protein CK203_100425 [Vitis vinifera]|uniref:Integrase catalytic domain-containing protein n=1 Tax=Vitis vinifera TaxID=29760 RepID=A0A438CJ34_VITVI|nr:hypothetical protein CK203_100425 [Vitis vinifera]
MLAKCYPGIYAEIVQLAFSDHHRLTNNVVEYEACITGLETALDLGVRQLEIHKDSNLVIQQTQGIWRTRDEKLKPYHAYWICWLIGAQSAKCTVISFTCHLRSFMHSHPLGHFQCGILMLLGKISPKSSSEHEYILVVVDYFTKWVEAASYARLTAARVVKFIRSHIICRYGVPHKLISDKGVHFRGEVDTLIQEYDIQHHRSSVYSRRLMRQATLYSLVYGMEAVLPVEIEMGSLRVALEQHIFKTEWAQSHYDQLSLLDERRLRATDHVQAYQRKMTRAIQKEDLTREGAAWLTDLDRNQFMEPVNVDQLKKFYA